MRVRAIVYVCVRVCRRARARMPVSLYPIFSTMAFKIKTDAPDGVAKYLKHDLPRFTKSSLDEFYDRTLKQAMRASFQVLTNVICIGLFIPRLHTEFLVLAPVIFFELKPKLNVCMTPMFHVPLNIVAANVAYFHTCITVCIFRIFT